MKEKGEGERRSVELSCDHGECHDPSANVGFRTGSLSPAIDSERWISFSIYGEFL